MPEQPQWSERTLDMPPQDPWADPPTTDMPPRVHRPGTASHADPTRQYPAGDPARAAGQPSSADPTRAAQRSPADPTRVAPPSAPQAPPSPFSSGRAAVTPRPQPQHFTEHEPTGTGWPGAEPPAQHHPLSWHIAQLRRGGEWSFAGLLFAFVCWGIWAISSDGDLTAPIIVFLVSVLVAGGVFALSRLVGRLVLERQLGRTRRTAKGSHVVAGLFLAGVGIAHLRQTEWVMTAFTWVVDLFR
ncbi:DNA-directed RNA polymerase II [Couchioplanes caeruleus]|uniref:DNA-directed RNA polymerase II n=1 Tax=Couchioplanes caeruleus TaxID=56438 RepID=UPI0020BDAAEC|nr:DNA-directed RNA polymerase II [Couchioplanes caeruleus]UQU63613.1 DNA-directed RNA polymerase II [Couchioplanes caeruleus]